MYPLGGGQFNFSMIVPRGELGGTEKGQLRGGKMSTLVREKVLGEEKTCLNSWRKL